MNRKFSSIIDKRKKLSKDNIINILFCVIMIAILLMPNSFDLLIPIGIYIISVSIAFMLKYKFRSNISLLIGMIALVSISMATSVCLNPYNTAFYWQPQLIRLSENIINAKAYALFLTMLYLFTGNVEEKNEIKKIKYEDNKIVFYTAFAVLLYILVFCFDWGTIGRYTAITDPKYEYATIIYIFAWLYSGGNKKRRIALLIYAAMYCGQALLFGSRATSFPMILVILLLLTKKNFNMKSISIIGLIGILFGNFIEKFRNRGFGLAAITETLKAGLFVNTISYSFYAGTQIIRYSATNVDKVAYCINFIQSIILGHSKKVLLALDASASGFYNGGGGFIYSTFYYIGGFIGVAVGGFVIAKILNKVFNSSSQLAFVLKLSITAYFIRWFVYYPISFFRASLFIPILIYYLIKLFNHMLYKGQNIIENKRSR